MHYNGVPFFMYKVFGGIMAKRNVHTFKKLQKELKRKKKSKEKMERRQGKKDQQVDVDGIQPED